MRPIERGPAPRTYSDYSHARDDLIERIGDYCSFCEIALHSVIAVEHALPKNKAAYPQYKLLWQNFLFACHSCNSTKGSAKIRRQDYFWPDLDNTVRAIEYRPLEPPRPHTLLNASEQLMAVKTINLVGLQRKPGDPDYSRRDRRWGKRHEVWGLAQKKAAILARCDSIEQREDIIEIAQARGFWSVWMAVFEHDGDMRKRLIDAFPGTAIDCFNPAEGYWAKPRAGAQI